MIHKNMARRHYPYRWKYDAFRALEHFVRIGLKEHPGMNESLNILEDKIHKGPLQKGKQYSGKRHYPLETTMKGRFNTYRALKILTHHRPHVFEKILLNKGDLR